jgi:hypothetical protein
MKKEVYGCSAKISKHILSEAKIDIISYTKKELACEMIEKIMEEHNINDVVIQMSFKEYDVAPDLFSYNFDAGYKEILGRARVSSYGRL